MNYVGLRFKQERGDTTFVITEERGANLVRFRYDRMGVESITTKDWVRRTMRGDNPDWKPMDGVEKVTDEAIQELV